ncbi:hypothetical protein [Vibrio marisflavi]|uniref:Fibronectin type-III domain-containing protein n=1 Tax=Vibrio marisflavi CECT 7928 TaxID=634439 RepID=A0ABN8E303_9VIBR|nr:hypothetical protein [Vibrio marisflavi]CAH0539608.1 hypothetical protein VMF7928_02283 [Vibrio marisflavi CECT 7928]
MINTILKSKKAKLLSSIFVLGAVAALSGCQSNSTAQQNDNLPGSFQLTSLKVLSPSHDTFDVSWNKSASASRYQVCLFDPALANHCLRLTGTTNETHQRVGLGNYKPTAAMEIFVIAQNSKGATPSSTIAKIDKSTQAVTIQPTQPS